MRSVIVKKEGEDYKEFPTMRLAASYLGYSEQRLGKALKNDGKINGTIVMFSATISKGVNKKYKPNGEESITGEDADLIIAKNKENGLKLERVYYEKRHGAILSTLCRKREPQNGKPFPLVGSVDCMQCCNFIGKNKEESYVLCAYNGKWYKEKEVVRRTRKKVQAFDK